MHIGILGTGFGKYHGELYKKIDPSIHLTFWGRDDMKLKRISSELICDYTTDINEFFTDRSFDFIDICLPSHLHAEYALKALENKHSIFIETPAVTSLKDGVDIMEAAKKYGKKALVNMFLRYDPYYHMIFEYSRNKKYGALKHLSIYRKTPPIWGRLGADNIALSLMIHDLDFVTWLSKDIKLDSHNVITNSDNSCAIIDCLLSENSLNVHLQGNSMLPLSSPFSVGYEATFEHAYISYFENSSRDSYDSECYIYYDDKKEKITLERDEHCKSLLKAAIMDFCNNKDSGLAIENALPALTIALKSINTVYNLAFPQ